jgi:hypothetical protein
MRCSDSPPPVPPRFVAFAWRYPGRIRVSFPRPPDAPAAGLELVTRYLPPGRCREDGGASQVPRGTSVNVPCSPTPAGSHAPGHCGAATRPSVNLTTSAPAMMAISGLNHTARSLAVYASQRRLPGRHARLAPGCWPALPDGAGYPQGPNERFPRSLPPFPSFSWRTKVSPLLHR